MKFKAAAHPLLAKPRRYFTSAIFVVCAVGVAGTVMSALNASLTEKDLLLSRAQTAASAMSSAEIKQLKGDESDLDKEAYKNIKGRLVRIHEENPDTRFTYLLGKNDKGLAFFYADSEHESSPDYSPPGQVYGEASSQLLAAFNEESPFVEGPIGDSYGNWVSALAPVIDESTGQVVAILGVDLPSETYFFKIATYMMIPILLALLPLLVLVRNRRLEAKEQEITNLKTQFVSVASHELRSPLGGALWAIQSLIKPGANPNITADQEKLLTSVYTNTAASLASVNEILDFSVFDRGKAGKLQREPVDLVDVINDTQKLLDLTAKEADVTIETIGDWPKHLGTKGDPSALKRAFNNIISNAVKYSPKGQKIEIGYQPEHSHHVISIRDHGIGIPKGEQERVLEGYYRARNATKVQAHGTGLGLWVTKLIIEQHKGRLWLKSEENHGTTVYVSLPDKKSSRRPPQSDSQSPQHPDSPYSNKP